MPDKITIDLTDMIERVQYGYNLTNDEARWLLGQIGQPVLRVKRCPRCGADGRVVCPAHLSPTQSITSARPATRYSVVCEGCYGNGYLPQPEPEYEVRQ